MLTSDVNRKSHNAFWGTTDDISLECYTVCTSSTARLDYQAKIILPVVSS